MSLDRAQAQDLLPLYAGGDLDLAERALVDEALARFPDLAPELEEMRQLDGLLARTLAPRAEPVAEAVPAWLRSPAVPLVRRHCPYCKDDLASEARVLCARCLTPHHEGCFSENHGCSLLGCGETRAIAADEAAQQLCPACSKPSPATAPFCAWCGGALAAGGQARPRHEVLRVAVPAAPTRRQEWARFAASVAVLLAGGLVVGWLFGNKHNLLLGQLWSQAIQERRKVAQEQVPESLLRLALAQSYYREHKLGAGDVYAPTFEAVEGALTKDDVWVKAQQAIWGPHPVLAKVELSLLRTRLWDYKVELHVLAPEAAAQHFWITATPVISPREREVMGPRPSYVVAHVGTHSQWPEVVKLDEKGQIPAELRCPHCFAESSVGFDHNPDADADEREGEKK